MHENLLGYLLGALDGAEQQEVRERLQQDPALREELAKLESRLSPLEQERWQHDPPPGLVTATCDCVDNYCCRYLRESSPVATARSFAPLFPEKCSNWTVLDVVVAAGIVIAASLMFFPAISNSRHQAQIQQCQNNFRRLGTALVGYSERLGGYFPKVATTGNFATAGIYGPKLMDAGLLSNASDLLCAGAPSTKHHDNFQVPTLEQLKNSNGAKLIRWQRTMGGDYGYNLGYFVNGKHYNIRNQNRTNFPIMSDRPIGSGSPQVTLNHNGRGHNVLFEDGHVRFVVGCRLTNPTQDDIFLSERGLVEAGTNPGDIVLGASNARPLISTLDSCPMHVIPVGPTDE